MVTAALVKELREKTGAGMMDCKKVLTETDGDLEKASELLRERGIAKAAKKSGRVAAEGIVDTNCNPEDLDYPIPGNDDAIRAVKLIADVMANAVIEGKQGESFETVEEQDVSEEAESMEQVVSENEEKVEE